MRLMKQAARIASALLAVSVLCFAPLGGITARVEAAQLLFSNNASTTIATAINSTATTVTVAASTGSKFPHPTGAQYFRATLVKSGTPSQFEIVKVVAGSSGDTFTIQRGQEGTAAQAWSVGDFFNLFVTAADMGDLLQADDLQAQGGNYATDSGTANAYVVALSPPITQHVVGMPIRVKIANTNTGNSTLNPGPGAIPIVTPDGSPLVPANLVAGGIATFIYDGSHYQLIGTYKQAFSQITGQIGNAQVPLGAVTQYTVPILTNPALQGSATAPTPPPGTNNTLIATTAFVNNAVASSTGSTGGSNPYWERRPSGVLDEWGQYTYTTVAGAHIVSFPVTFSSVQSVTFTVETSSLGWDTWILQGSLSTSGFQIFDDAPSAHTVTINWRAVGR